LYSASVAQRDALAAGSQAHPLRTQDQTMAMLTNPTHPPIQSTAERSAGPIKRFALPPLVRSTGKVLLHQQCWLWGKDLRSPEGNLLMRYGFTRHPLPEDAAGCTAYRLQLTCGSVLLLWGFGFYFSSPPQANRGGIIVGRYEFRPRLTPLADPPMPVWQSEQIPGRTLPQSTAEFAGALQLFAQGMRAIHAYESWIANDIGLAYRRGVMREWDRDFVPVEGMAETWLAMAERCEARLARLG